MKGFFRQYWKAGPAKLVKKRLSSNLSTLKKYCLQPVITPSERTNLDDLQLAIKEYISWPSWELLEEIEADAMALIRFELVKRPRPFWKAFLLLDKRNRSFKAVQRLNSLARRARECLNAAGFSMLEELSSRHGKDAPLLRDIKQLKRDAGAAKAIDWARHEGMLKRLSRTGTVELACGTSAASVEVRCYARVLELVVEDDQHEALRRRSGPLVEWLTRIEHPDANQEVFRRHAAADLAEAQKNFDTATKARIDREKKRARDRRYRARKNSLPD